MAMLAASGVGCGRTLVIAAALLASSVAIEDLACLQAGVATGQLGLRPSDLGRCLPDREPQLTNVGDYYMVLDVANWESHHVTSMILGLLLSEHLGYNVVFNDGPLRNKFNRPLVTLDENHRPERAPPWLWAHGSGERQRELGEVLDCVADGITDFSVVNIEAWNLEGTEAQDWVREGHMRGDSVGYFGQSGWFMPAVFGQGVGNLYSHYQGLNAQPPPVWAAEGFVAGDMIRCNDPNLMPCTPQRGQGTPADCRSWCPHLNASTIPLWAIHASYDAGYVEELIYNNNLDISVHYVGAEEHHRKASAAFQRPNRPGPVLFYSWEPSALIHSLPSHARFLGGNSEDFEVSRLFLPNSVCHRPHMENGPPDSKYRCDYPQQSLQKLVSANMEVEAPFAYDFVMAFKITQKEIEDSMRTLFARQYGNATPLERRQMLFDVACEWVIRTGNSQPLPNSTQTSFHWSQWKRSEYWFSQMFTAAKLFSRNAILVAFFLLVMILVERCCVGSSLNLENFVCRVFSPCPWRKKVQRTGSSLSLGIALPDSEVAVDLTEEVKWISDHAADVRLKLENSDASALEAIDEPMTNGPCDKPFAQLCAETMWCRETDTAVKIGIFLNQPSSEQVRIGYTTEDGTASAGARYEKTVGELVFEPGELVKAVEVNILDSQDWDAGTYFDFRLQRNNSNHLSIGLCNKSRVQIIDSDVFPKSKGTTDEQRLRMTKRGALLEHLRNEYVRFRTSVWFALAARSYIAFHGTVVVSLLQKFLLDEAVTAAREDVDHQLVMILGALFFLFTCCERVAENVVVKYSKGAAVAAELQIQLYTKLWMMNSLTRDTRLEPARWISAIMRHCKEVAHDGWVAVMELFEECVRLFCLVVFTFVLCSDLFRQTITYSMVFPPVLLIAIIPVAWWLGIEVRKPGQVKKREDVDRGMTNIYDGFNWILLHGKDLVRLGRGHSSQFLEEQRRAFRREAMGNCKAEVADNLYKLDTAWIVTWMSTVMHVCFFITGGLLLIESEHYGQVQLSTGTFVALMGIFKSFGQALRSLFQICVRMEIASLALHKIAELLNAETQEVAHLNRQQLCLDSFLPQLKNVNHQVSDVIQFRDVSFAYENGSPVIEHFEGSIQLGRIVALEDVESKDNILGGQVTLLRLIKGDLMPTGGEVVLPPHLRIGIVETVPALVGDNLLKNVTVLALKDTDEVEAYRPKLDSEAWCLATLLGMQADPMSPDSHAIPTTAYIAMTARVMLSDPDVLLVLTSRWQGGPWLGTLLRGLVRWQQTGLQALLGRDDPRDQKRQRSLLLTMDSAGLEQLQVGDVYSFSRLNEAGVEVQVSKTQTGTGEAPESPEASVVRTVLSEPKHKGGSQLRSWSMKEPVPNHLPASTMRSPGDEDARPRL